jgi:hypothetical protein
MTRTGSDDGRPSSWVYRELPLSLVRWVGVQSDRYASQVGKLLVDHALAQRIIVRPNWHYGYGRR